MKRENNSTGQSLIEVVVVAGILGLALTALVSIISVTVARNRLSSDRSVAVRMAQGGIEWIREQRDENGFDYLKNHHPSGVYCLGNDLILSDSGGGCEGNMDTYFGREIYFNWSGDEASVEVTVVWPPDEQVSLTTSLYKDAYR